jgi:hypothetical protein
MINWDSLTQICPRPTLCYLTVLTRYAAFLWFGFRQSPVDRVILYVLLCLFGSDSRYLGVVQLTAYHKALVSYR